MGLQEDMVMGYRIEKGKLTEYWSDMRPTDFVISGPYSVWVKILKGELSPIKALTMRKLKVKGSLPLLLKFNRATLRWVELLRQIPTRFHFET